MDIVSACLVGCNCRYDGGNQLRPDIEALFKQGLLLPVCPEQLGGLTTPRPPAEEREGKMLTVEGNDVTSQYATGAKEALALLQLVGAKKAYLKSRSPMCGHGQIYDGSHSGKLTSGDGVFTKLLLNHNIKIERID